MSREKQSETEKIKVICTNCNDRVSNYGTGSFREMDVDGRMFRQDGSPIIGKNATGEDYHLGKVCSSRNWIIKDFETDDCFGEELRKLFPNGYKFEFDFSKISQYT